MGSTRPSVVQDTQKQKSAFNSESLNAVASIWKFFETCVFAIELCFQFKVFFIRILCQHASYKICCQKWGGRLSPSTTDKTKELAGERSFFDKLRQRLRRRGGLYLSSLLHCCKILPCVCASHIFHHNSCINDLYWPKLWFLWGYVLNVAVSRWNTVLFGFCHSSIKMATQKILWSWVNLCVLSFSLLSASYLNLVGFRIWENFQWSNEWRTNNGSWRVQAIPLYIPFLALLNTIHLLFYSSIHILLS